MLSVEDHFSIDKTIEVNQKIQLSTYELGV